MTFTNKLKMAWDSTGVVTKLIEEWEPGTLKNEKQYENSLFEILSYNLEGIDIIKQYGKGRIRADIVVADKVLIELKNNLDSTSKYQRLIGQLTDYKKWDGVIIVLLCGKTDPSLLRKVEDFASDHTGFTIVDQDQFVVMTKNT